MTTPLSFNRTYRLASRPKGEATLENFAIQDEPLCPLADGEVRVRVTYLSVDPTQRIWMSDRPQYLPPVGIGEVMRALGVGEVVESRSSRFTPGAKVSGLLGWQTLATLPEKELILLPDIGVPEKDFVGTFGMASCTAYFGMEDIGRPRAGEIVVVSAAAGAVGSVACQLAKNKGAFVIGIAGGEEKCAIVKREFRADVAIDYKQGKVFEQLKEHAPKGIDVYFENVGGTIFEAVLDNLAIGARIPFCGTISGYNASEIEAGPRNLAQLVMRRATLQGFLILDYQARMAEAVGALAKMRAEGRLVTRETVMHGLDNALPALHSLFSGGNVGKLMLAL